MAGRPSAVIKPIAQAKADKERAEQPTTAEVYKAARFNPDTVRGELGDFIISRMKAAKHIKDWEAMSEEEQREQIEQALHWSDTIIAGVVQAVMSKGLPHRAVKLGKFNGAVGETTVEIKATLVLDNEVGGRLSGGITDAVMVFASEEAFKGGEMETRAEPNERALALDGEGGETETPHDPDTGEIEDDAPAPVPTPPPADTPAPAP